MSNPYLSFLASLGGSKDSHSTLKKLAATSAATPSSPVTAASSTAASSSSLPPSSSQQQQQHPRSHPSSSSSSFSSSSSTSRRPSANGPKTHRPSSSSSDRHYSSSSRHGSSFSHSSSSHSSSSKHRSSLSSSSYSSGYDRDARHSHSKSLSHLSSSSSRASNTNDRQDSKLHAVRRPVSNDSHVSSAKAHQRHDSLGTSRNGAHDNGAGLLKSSNSASGTSKDNHSSKVQRDERISSNGNKSTGVTTHRKRERQDDVAPSSSSSGVATKDTNVLGSEARAVKRQARSRTRSKSPGSRRRSRSRSRSRSKSPPARVDSHRQSTPPPPAPLAPLAPLSLPQQQQQQPATTQSSSPLHVPAQPMAYFPSTPPHKRTFVDFDDTSSLSTLSSPSSFSPSPTPRSMPSSPVRRMDMSPSRTKMTLSMVPGQDSYSSPSSLSSLSPDQSNRTSLDLESGPLDSAGPSPYLSTPTEPESTENSNGHERRSKDLNHTNTLQSQESLEMALFGALSKPATENRKDTCSSPKDIKMKSREQGKDVDEDGDDDSEAFLGTAPKPKAKPSVPQKKSGTNGKRPLHSKGSGATREIVVINLRKGSVTTRMIPTAPKPKTQTGNNGKAKTQVSTSKPKLASDPSPPKKVTATLGGATSTATASTGNGSSFPRKMSLLHSDQIVAAAMSRYKNHFHMLIEDSDSTVASNPSSTGADTMHVSLEYPGKDSREKFTLMKPFLSRSKAESDDKDEYNPIEDLVQTVRTIMEFFFTPTQYKELFGTPNEGLYRSLTKYKVRKDGAQFMKAVDTFNTIMRKQKASGEIAKHIESYGHRLPYDLVVHILSQVYSRTVAARASKLNQYEAFSNNVYGEILPILTKEFIQRAKLDHTKVFVDLGCGIGNVVLQVALQTGAESYGVEIMDTPAKFAKKQAKEFEARSRAYGLSHGSVKMIHGDFLDSPELAGILARADLVLVNNYAFNSALNQSLLQLFLDLKEGCKIISLKTFVSLDHKINVRNAGSVESILRVKKYPYYTNAVSWTHNGGEYFIATVDRAPVQAFWERALSDGGAGLDDGGGRRSSSRRR